MPIFSSFRSKVALIFGFDGLLMLIAISRALLLDRNPMRYFDEGGFITWLSILQLLGIAYLCHCVSKLRLRLGHGKTPWRHAGRIWQVMMLGFIFLALDECFEIHEGIDAMIHSLFNLDKAGIWSRIDDFIILLYAIVGVGFLWKFRQELQKFSASLKWFVIGFGFCFLTIFLDMLSHNAATLAPWIQDADQLYDVHLWLKVTEEIPKILAEGAFMAAFYRCLLIARRQFDDQTSARLR